MQNIKFVVRWSDNGGRSHRRVYDDEESARMAKKWLIQNGSPSVDIATKIKEREYVIADRPDPVDNTRNQQTFL